MATNVHHLIHHHRTRQAARHVRTTLFLVALFLGLVVGLGAAARHAGMQAPGCATEAKR